MLGGEKIKTQKFGMELEMTGLSREKAANVIAAYFGTRPDHVGRGYDTYEIPDTTGRKWKIVSDSSIDARYRDGTRAPDTYRVEMVTPICKYEDIPDIQEIVRQLRHAGARCNESCGIHVHVDAAPYDARTLRNLVNIFASKEKLIYSALKVNPDREIHYCRQTEKRFVEELNRVKPRTMERIKSIWYDGRDGSDSHYHSSRYHGLNLHSVFSKGTVEVRAINATTHAGKIRAYLTFCLAISHQALTQRSASYVPRDVPNEKYAFRVWLVRLGLNGEEFKNVRGHLLENLDGNIAWRDPAQQERQRERLRLQRQEQAQVTTEYEEQNADTDITDVGISIST